MTRDDIIRMAREQGLSETATEGVFRVNTDDLGRMLAAEREACAAICDELESFWSAEKDAALLNGDVALSNATSGEPRAARAIADAIRARGKTDAP